MSCASACALSLLALAGAVGQSAAQEGEAEAQPAAEQKPAVTIHKQLGPLLKELAAVKTFQADYQEEKHMDLLLEPLKSHGKVYFDAAGKRLARHTVSPFASVLVVTAKWVGVLEDDRWELVDLQRQPVVMQVVSGFMKVLAGDRAGLEKIYTLEFVPQEDADSDWAITLTPKVEPLDKIIASIEIRGRGVTVTRMRVLEVIGDETVTTFTAVRRDVVYTEEQREAYFPAPEPARERP